MKETVRIAIIEDDETARKELVGYFDRYRSEHGQPFDLFPFGTATSFSVAQDNYDIIFMDILLPDGNGMEIVRRLRKADNHTLVIFVTNMVQYSVKGYEVRAFDFIVKPVNYYNFSLKLSDALAVLAKKRDDEIWINAKNTKRRLSVSGIVYIDIMNHYVTYHTVDGSYTAFGSLSEVQNKLSGRNFILCNRCYLVNLDYVNGVTATSVQVGDIELQISRQKRAEFMKALNEYVTNGGFV